MTRIIIELTDEDIEWARYGLLDPDFLADKVKNALAVPEREKETDEEKDPWEYMDDIEREEAREYLESLQDLAEWEGGKE